MVLKKVWNVVPFSFAEHEVIWKGTTAKSRLYAIWDLGLTSYNIWVLLELVGNHEILSLQSSEVNWNQRGITHSIVLLITPSSRLPPPPSHKHRPLTTRCRPRGKAAAGPLSSRGMAGRCLTAESLKPIKNACNRGKGCARAKGELVTSPYIIPQPQCCQFSLKAGNASRFMAGVLCWVRGFGWENWGGVDWDPARLGGISGSGLRGWSYAAGVCVALNK